MPETASAIEPRPYDGVAAGHIQAPAVMRATMSAMGTWKVGDSAGSAVYHARHWAEVMTSRRADSLGFQGMRV